MLSELASVFKKHKWSWEKFISGMLTESSDIAEGTEATLANRKDAATKKAQLLFNFMTARYAIPDALYLSLAAVHPRAC